MSAILGEVYYIYLKKSFLSQFFTLSYFSILCIDIVVASSRPDQSCDLHGIRVTRLTVQRNIHVNDWNRLCRVLVLKQ